MKTLEELENTKKEAKNLLDAKELELIDISGKIESLKKIYKEHLKIYTIYQKNFIKADSDLNKFKTQL